MSDSTTESETVSAASPVDIVEIVEIDAGEQDEREERMKLAIRQVLERQIAAGQALSSQLVDAATDVTTAIAHAPATFAGAIQDGETVASAWERTGAGVQGVLGEAGGRLRVAVTTYVGHQATLPVAVLGYAGEIAGSLVSAQGTVAGSALDSAFAVASAAAQGDNVRQAFDRNIGELRATAVAARGDVAESARRAGQEVRGAVAIAGEDS